VILLGFFSYGFITDLLRTQIFDQQLSSNLHISFARFILECFWTLLRSRIWSREIHYYPFRQFNSYNFLLIFLHLNFSICRALSYALETIVEPALTNTHHFYLFSLLHLLLYSLCVTPSSSLCERPIVHSFTHWTGVHSFIRLTLLCHAEIRVFCRSATHLGTSLTVLYNMIRSEYTRISASTDTNKQMIELWTIYLFDFDLLVES